jgi:FixJ family two-component response regulator
VTVRPTPPPDLASTEKPIVFVIDEDASVREALKGLLRSVGFRVKVLNSASEFLQSKLPDVASCLIFDIGLPRSSDLDVQAELATVGVHVPIIVITGHGDIPMSVRAMKAGAIDFLTKPLRDEDILNAVATAIERDRRGRNRARTRSDLQVLFATLSSREREVMALVVTGRMNKQVAAEIGIAEITVKMHRRHIMKKMAAKSFADLVRAAEALGIGNAS